MKHFFCLIIFAFFTFNLSAQVLYGIEPVKKCHTAPDGTQTSFLEWKIKYNKTNTSSYYLHRELINGVFFPVQNTGIERLGFCESYLSAPTCYERKVTKCTYLVNGVCDTNAPHTGYQDPNNNTVFTGTYDMCTLAGQNIFKDDLAAWLITQDAAADSITIFSNVNFNEILIFVYGTSLDLAGYSLVGNSSTNTSRTEQPCVFFGETTEEIITLYFTSDGQILDEKLQPTTVILSEYQKVSCTPDVELIKQCFAIPDSILLCDYSTSFVANNTDEEIIDFQYFDENAVSQSTRTNSFFRFPYDAINEIQEFEDDLNSFLLRQGSKGTVTITTSPNVEIIFSQTSIIPQRVIRELGGQSTFGANQNCTFTEEGYNIFEVYYDRDGDVEAVFNEGFKVAQLPGGASSVDCTNPQGGASSGSGGNPLIDCTTIRNVSEDVVLTSNNSFTIPSNSVFSYAMVVQLGSGSYTRNATTVLNLAQGYAQSMQANGCNYLQTAVTFTAANNSTIIITTLK